MHRPGSFVLVLALLGVLLVSEPAQAGVTTNVNVSRMNNNQSEASVAVDPTNPQNVVIVSNLEHNYALMLGVSHDGGATFRHRPFANGAYPSQAFGQACCDPTLSWDQYGNLFLIWLDSTDFTIIRVALSTDGGDAWTQLGPYAPPPPPGPPGAAQGVPTRNAGLDEGRGSFIDQPTVTTGSGSVWVVWSNRNHMQAVGAAVTGLGAVASFGATQDIPGTKGCSFGDVAVGPAGQVMQVCTRDIAKKATEIQTNLDPDGLGPAPFGPVSAIGSTNVGQFDPIRPQQSRTVDSEAGLAWDRSGGPQSGRLYLIYTDAPSPISSQTDIFMRTSDDAGLSWTARVRVNSVRTRAQFLPKIALDQSTGLVAIGWYDCQNDNGDHRFGDTDGVKNDDAMYYMTETDGNGTFIPEIRVSKGVSNAVASNNGIDYGDYTGLAFQNGVVHPAWADNSNSTGDNPNGRLHQFDIYTASVNLT